MERMVVSTIRNISHIGLLILALFLSVIFPVVLCSTGTLAAVSNAPSDLVAVAVSATQINITWQDNSVDELGFKVERRTGSGIYEQITIADADETSYSDTGLNPDTVYWYRARSYNADGNSAYSNEASATTRITTLYENYNTDDDAGAQAYEDNWLAQTFCTNDDPDDATTHTVSQVKLKLYRVGTPGKVYVILREGTIGGPTGGNYAIGIIEGDTLTDDTDGDWYTFTLDTEINLLPNEISGSLYSVLLAADGDVSNCVYWRYDNAGAYTYGKYFSSDDGGDTWSDTAANDFMFEIWGNPSLEIISVRVFSSLVTDGDWLICAHYNCTTPPAYPAEDVTEYFNMYLWDGDRSRIAAQVKLPAWGYRPAAIYMSPATVANAELYWGSGYYAVVIEGTDLWWSDPPPTTEHYLQPQDWAGNNLFLLDDWVRGTAQLIEAYYGVDVYTERIPSGEGDIILEEGEGVLTLTGGEIFTKGIPGLEEIRPDLFYAVVHSPDITTTEPTGAYEDMVTWEEQVGPQIAETFYTWGDMINLDGQVLGGTLAFIILVSFVAVGVATEGVVSIIAVVAAIPIALGTWYFRLWPMAIAAVLSIAIALIAFWIIWLRST